uniref:RNA-directed DNA polymerase n=1 Tax=Sweet potato vein clearing virus TaxID=995049 RepID=A0A2R4VA48_9VIRU|nr:replicase [Sweet potato vein clearing virus]
MKIHILVKVICEGYKSRYYTPMIDTGAEISICKMNCLPDEYWKEIKNDLIVRGFNNEGSVIDRKASNISIQIWDKIVKIDHIYQFEIQGKDIILGMNFIRMYLPHKISKDFWYLTTPCGKMIGAKIVENKERFKCEWEKGDKTLNQKLRNVYDFSLVRNQIRTLFSENPLEFWEKHRTEVKIELINPDSIVYQKPLRWNFEDIEEFKLHIDELLKGGFIRPSNSKHSSPAFIVNKHSEQKRGKSRMVIDYRNLNAKTKTYNYPLPNKILRVRQVQGYNWFSKFDCKSGFYHLKLTEDSKHLSAFNVPQGFYEFNVLMFGYKNAPGRYQCYMDSYFSKLENCIVYIDDILLYSKTKDEHETLLKKFYYIAKEAGVSLSEKKAIIGVNQIEFLGIEIDKSGVKMQNHIVTKIIQCEEVLDTKKKLQSFLGLINQVREYVPNIAKELLFLQKKLKKDVEYHFDSQDQEKLKKIKEKCSNLPKLLFPDETKQFDWIVETDASEISYGGVLKYKYHQDKIEYHCRYYSGTFKDNEKNWEINRKELLSVFKCLYAFEPYIVYNKFILRTDNTQVKYWLTGKLDNSVTTKEIRRLVVKINCYNFDVVVIKSKDNCFADYLSREVKK